MEIILDHLVHFTDRHPLEAAEFFKKQGLTAVMGGRHEKWGSHNSLCYFSDLAYLEFLSIEDRKKANGSDNPLIHRLLKQRAEGLGQIALRSDNLQHVKAELEEKGLETGEILEAGRKREDGSLLEWKMLFIEQSDDEAPLPFFIEWKQSEDERKHDLFRSGALSSENTGVSVAKVHYIVRDLNAAVLKWRKYFDLPRGEEAVYDEWRARIYTFSLPSFQLIFAEPSGDGLVQQMLERKGEGPYLAEFDPPVFGSYYQVHGSMYK
ncbi:VOC family protein [Metabacillus indicus]|uniref:VOC family protein n=1 Tax=Metabacillus indicus TaxID=246786 RepID=UPI003CF25C32